MPPRKKAFSFEDIYRLREASALSLAADGTVAFAVAGCDEDKDENTSEIWSVRGGSEPKRLTNGPSDAAPAWSPDGSQLAFMRRHDGKPQIFLLPTRGGEARKLTDMPMGCSGMRWSPDSSRLAVIALVDLEGDASDDAEKQRRASAPNVITSSVFKSDGAGLLGSRRVQLFVVDVSSGETEQVVDGDVNASAPAWSPNGKRIAFALSDTDRETLRTRLMVVDAGGGKPVEVALWPDGAGTAGAPFWSSDGRTIGFAGAPTVGARHTRLYRVPATGGEPEELAPAFDRNVMVGGPAYPGAPPTFLDDGRILFCARDRGCTNAFVLGDDGEVTKVFGGEDSVVGGVSRSGDATAYLLTTPDHLSEVYVDGARLTHLNDELLSKRKIHPCVSKTFAAPDGLEMQGWVIVGDGPKPQPLLVDIHGGPHNAWSPVLDAVHIYHDILASQGWSILRLNPRASDGYGEDFLTASVGAWGTGDEDDFLSAIDALIDEGIADPDRLAVCGYSYGGYMTNWLTSRSDRFKAAMSGGTVSDLRSIYGTSDLGWYLGVHEFGGELHDVRDDFERSSPIARVESVTTPTLILHGESDDRCPVGQAEQWFTSLRRLGVETELVRYPGGSHLFIVSGRPSHRVDYNRRIAEWMTKHVK